MGKPRYYRPADIKRITDTSAVSYYPQPDERDRDPNDFDDGYSNILPKSVKVATAIGFEDRAQALPPYPEMAEGVSTTRGTG
jgi:hypothetical protein